MKAGVCVLVWRTARSVFPSFLSFLSFLSFFSFLYFSSFLSLFLFVGKGEMRLRQAATIVGAGHHLAIGSGRTQRDEVASMGLG